jgi:hypothetical protein
MDEAARREGLAPSTLRRWLADRDFRAALAAGALEPALQTTSAMLEWAPAALARLIRDLQGDSAADARQAAREILKLALDAQRELARAADEPAHAAAQDPLGALMDDPLVRRVGNLSDDQLAEVLAIINAPKGDRP